MNKFHWDESDLVITEKEEPKRLKKIDELKEKYDQFIEAYKQHKGGSDTV